MKDIKTFNLFLLTQIRVGNFTSHINKQNLGFYQMYNKNDYKNQIAELSRFSINDSNINQFIEILTSKNNELSEKMDKINDDLIKLNIATKTTLFQPNYSTIEQKINNRINLLEEDIENINISIKNINQMCHKSNEAWPKMNNQLHILSAKYINFNSKINNFMHDFKMKKNTISNDSNIIDEDAMNFIAHNHSSNFNNQNHQSKQNGIIKQTNEPVNISSENIFISDEKQNQSIHGVSNKLNYTQCIKVTMKNTNIFDLHSISHEVYRYFNSTLGMNIVKTVNINKFSMSNNTIDSISVYVSFNDPLSYDFLQKFKFPSNWFFMSTRKYLRNR